MSPLKLGEILLGAAAGVMVLCVLLINITENTLFGILALLAAAVGIGAWFLLGRCQDCGRFLGRTGGKHCPHCGAKLKR